MSANTILASAVQPKSVRWLWPGWLPEGVLVVLDRDPGVGKSTLTIDLAARLSRGELAGRPVTTILINGEDTHENTVRPRLGRAGADLDRVVLWKFDEPPSLPRDIDKLREAIREHGAGLLVIDPLSAFLGREASAVGDQTVRRALMPLIHLAAETGCTILIVRHLRKQNGRALYRGLGSIGIVGAARVGWLLGHHPRGEGLRVLTATKMNLAECPDPRVFRTADGAVTWIGDEPWLTPDDVTGAAPGSAAAGWLELVLARGPKPAAEVKAEAAATGISERTLWRAKRLLAVVSRRYYDIWFWCKPGDDPAMRFGGLSPTWTIDDRCQSEVEAGPTPEPRDPQTTAAEQMLWAKQVLKKAGKELTGDCGNGTTETTGTPGTDESQESQSPQLSHSKAPSHGNPGLHSAARPVPEAAVLSEGGSHLRFDLPLLPPVSVERRPHDRSNDPGGALGQAEHCRRECGRGHLEGNGNQADQCGTGPAQWGGFCRVGEAGPSDSEGRRNPPLRPAAAVGCAVLRCAPDRSTHPT
jgi:hypothetical protein